jgi:hypothetical protein
MNLLMIFGNEVLNQSAKRLDALNFDNCTKQRNLAWEIPKQMKGIKIKVDDFVSNAKWQ